MKKPELNLENELSALRHNLLSDTSLSEPDSRLLGGLNGLIRQGTENKGRDMRMAILREWTGYTTKAITGKEMESSKDLTEATVKFLVKLLHKKDSTPWRLTEYGKELIEETEKAINERWKISQLELELET